MSSTGTKITIDTPITGSVARKIALFQSHAGNRDCGDSQSVNPGPLRLRRKDGIKRKHRTTGTISSSASVSSSAADFDTHSTCISITSSDSCYGGSNSNIIADESQEFSCQWPSKRKDSLLLAESVVGRTCREKRINWNQIRNTSNGNDNLSRSVKDSYQSFSMPRLSSRPLCFQLVEFSNFNLEETDTSEAFYEELDFNKNGQDFTRDGAAAILEQEVLFDQSLSSSVPGSTDGESDEKSDRSFPQQSPPSPPPYECIYSEPIYGDTGSSSGSMSSYWTTTSSVYNTSTNGSLFPTNNVLLNNTAICPPLGPPRLPVQLTTTPINFGPISTTLPPLPVPNPVSNKFSSIARSAGKKIVKRFDYIRRLSRTTSLDGSGSSTPEPLSLPPNSLTTNQNQNQSSSSAIYNRSQDSTGSNGGMKRCISRPRIPPPDPPPKSSVVKNVKNRLKLNNNSTNEDEDFEDSDFCDSDSELIRNFVSTVQPIYSMEEEPLYQYYTYGISFQAEDNYQPIIPKNLGLTLEMLMPRVGQRTLWCEIPEVQSSGILSILSEKQKHLQEAIFEILTSEVSYLKSLDVLISLFYENEELIQVLSETDRAALFGNIKDVKDGSKSFLTELLAKWEESWYIQEVGQVITENSRKRFGVYRDYCRNKPYQDTILQQLRSTSDEFVGVVRSIEENKRCEMLRMDSFLMLPMQRITRLPLLVNAVLQRTQSTKEKIECEEALKTLTQLVIECNEAARESQDLEETGRMMEKLEFPKGLRQLGNPGQFVLKGDFMKNPFDSGRGNKINWTFQKSKRTYFWLILFTHQLFIAKKRSSGKLEVIETISPKESYIKILPSLEGISKDFQYYFMLHFDGCESIYFLAGRTQSEVERWKSKLEELKAETEVKVEALFPYKAKREDELSFTVAEVITVRQKQPDGWYFGSKKNGEEGWFPGNYTSS